MKEVLKHVNRLVRVSATKGKLVNAMGLLSHVAAEIVGHSSTEIDSDEYSLIISTLQEWQNKIDLEQSKILEDIVAGGHTANKTLETTQGDGQ